MFYLRVEGVIISNQKEHSSFSTYRLTEAVRYR